jgi:hypothetical protein
MKLSTFIIAPEPISTAYFVNPSHQSVCIYVPPIVAKQRLGKKRYCGNKYTCKIEELLDMSFSMRSVSYQIKVGDQFFPEIIIRKYI